MDSDYALAVRRDMRDSAPRNWQQQVASIPGLHVLGASGERMQISASELAFAELRRRFSAFLHIEPIVHHSGS